MVKKYLIKSVYIPEEYQEIYEKFEKIAEKENRSISYMIIKAIETFVKEYKK